MERKLEIGSFTTQMESCKRFQNIMKEVKWEYRSFYANGNLKIRGYFTLGFPDSTFEAYYFNGQLAEKGSYKTVPYINPKDTIQLLKNIEKTDAIESVKINNWAYYYMNGKIMEKLILILLTLMNILKIIMIQLEG